MEKLKPKDICKYLRASTWTFAHNHSAEQYEAAELVEQQQQTITDLCNALDEILKAHAHVYGLDGAWDSEVTAAKAALAKARGEL